MERRTHESPMDFQWQQGHGPASADSPFLKNAANHQQHLNGFAGQKRPFDQCESPTKPSIPSLRDPASQTFLFPSTPTMKPPIPYRNPSFTTPQRSMDIDFSSGPENGSSPINADNEDTPEHPQRNDISKTNGATVQFAGVKLEKKPPSFPISGRGEIARKFYTDAIPRRVQKRRRRDADRDLRLTRHRGTNYESDSDSGPSGREGGTSSQKKQPPLVGAPQIGLIPSIFTFIERHPNLPHILSYYAQFLLNAFLVFFLMYLVYSFWSTIRSDVDLRSREVAIETLGEMAVCAREFKENRCDRSSRVPAMETVCDNWEKCMNQDPSKVSRARVSAYTFAEILNNFVEPISIKTMIVSFSLIFGCFAISNMTLMFFRNKIPAPHPPQPPPPAASSRENYYNNMPPHYYPPQPIHTPQHQRHPEQYFTPYHNHQNRQGMAHSEEAGSGFVETPVRLRLGYR